MEKEYIFDFNLSAWIKDVTVEAESEDEAKEKLYKMSLEEMLDSGYVKESDISDISYTLNIEDYLDTIVSDLAYEEEQYYKKNREHTELANNYDLFKDYIKEQGLEEATDDDIETAWDNFLDEIKWIDEYED